MIMSVNNYKIYLISSGKTKIYNKNNQIVSKMDENMKNNSKMVCNLRKSMNKFVNN